MAHGVISPPSIDALRKSQLQSLAGQEPAEPSIIGSHISLTDAAPKLRSKAAVGADNSAED
jgi:hypothetical protein